MKIAILGKPFDEEYGPFIQNLFDELQRRKADILVVEHFSLFLQNRINLPEGIPTFTRGDSWKE
ncbi:inorganic polyphosphate/ATP-NAD kinase [Pontibacter sp. BAB1700]|nr:inorganic polyphosphate/ATP-NAD kinase [Pontibacter sp. BAB1700]